MKQTKAIAIALTVLLFFGCSKYDDNTGFNLSSKNKRLIGEWELDYYKSVDQNDIEISIENGTYETTHPSAFSGYPYNAQLNINEDGYFEYQIIQEVNLPDTAFYQHSWSWLDGSSKKEMLRFGGNNGLGFVEDYHITKLTKDALWLKAKHEFKTGNFNTFNDIEYRFKK